jgi:hypothetical protein
MDTNIFYSDFGKALFLNSLDDMLTHIKIVKVSNLDKVTYDYEEDVDNREDSDFGKAFFLNSLDDMLTPIKIVKLSDNYEEDTDNYEDNYSCEDSNTGYSLDGSSTYYSSSLDADDECDDI